MLNHVLLVAWRSVRRQPGTTAISLASLVTGLAVCLLLLLHVRHERAFDQHWADADRLVRVVTEERSEHGVEQTALTTGDLTPVVWDAQPAVPLTRVYRWPYSDIRVAYEDEASGKTRAFDEARFFRVDSTFTEAFALDVLAGDPATALRTPYSLILTASTAARYFDEADPLGRTLRVNDRSDYTVTGLVADPPAASHFQYDLIAFNGRGFPDGWGEKKVWTYAKLPAALPVAQAAPSLTAALANVVVERFPEHLRGATTLSLQPVRDIHLDIHLTGEMQAGGSRRMLAVMLAVAIGFLLMAVVNHVNLATARAEQRAREIGVRKAVGASRATLVRQLVGEAMLTSVVATIAAAAVVHVVRPITLAQFGIGGPEIAWTSAPVVLMLVGLAVSVGLLAGAYPAVYLTALRPSHVLKGTMPRRRGEVRLREALVVVQFAAAVVLLVGALVTTRQMAYLTDGEQGIDRDNVMLVSVPRALAEGVWDWSPDVLQSEFRRVPAVREVSAVDVPWGPDLEPYRIRRPEAEGQVAANVLWVSDPHYADLYGLMLRDGRTNLRAYDPDAAIPLDLVVNETAAQQLGLEADRAVGSEIELATDVEEEAWVRACIVGLVEDAPYRTLHHAIEPLLFVRGTGFSTVAVRLAGQDLPAEVAAVGAVWQRLAPDHPFDFVFLDDDYRQQYLAEAKLVVLARAITALSLAIACLGLLGLTSFLVAQRRREIGVRKVLGASVASVLGLLTRDYVRLVLIALAIALPLGWLGARHWLASYPFRASLGADVFLIAGALVLGVMLLTVSVHALRAALVDPVRALRHE